MAPGFAAAPADTFAFTSISEAEWGARPPRALFSAPPRKTPDAGNLPATAHPARVPEAGREGASSHARGRACSPTSEFGFTGSWPWAPGEKLARFWFPAAAAETAALRLHRYSLVLRGQSNDRDYFRFIPWIRLPPLDPARELEPLPVVAGERHWRAGFHRRLAPRRDHCPREQGRARWI